jgi:hypothetical protein
MWSSDCLVTDKSLIIAELSVLKSPITDWESKESSHGPHEATNHLSSGRGEIGFKATLSAKARAWVSPFEMRSAGSSAVASVPGFM